jgi:phage major head subunit gpT-like protein
MSRIELTNRAVIGSVFHAVQSPALGWVDRVAMKFESDQASEKYAWLGQNPSMRQRLGHGLNPTRNRASSFEIANLPYEATLAVTGDEYRRDKTDQVQARINGMGVASAKHWASLVSTLMLNGAATACYDSQYFYDTDHSEGDSGSQSNKLSVDISALPTAVHGSTTAPSPAEFQLAMLQGIQAIMGFKDDRGELYWESASEFLVSVPIPLWQVAIAATRLPMIDNGNSSLVANLDDLKLNVHANGRLTWTDTFAVHHVGGDVKPFITQDEYLEPIEIGFDSEHFAKNDEALFGVRASRGAGYGMWQSSCQIIMI